MRPIVEQHKKNQKLWILYITIFIVCTLGIGIALYMQYYKDEKIGIIFGITGDDSEKQDEYNELKAEFNSIFNNKLENLDDQDTKVEKIREDYNIVVTAYAYQKNEGNCTLDVSIPYFNIKGEIPAKINTEIKNDFKSQAEKILSNQSNIENVIFTVEYEAFLQNNILSLVIQSEYKEENKSQKIIVKTYNYNLTENKLVTLEDLLKIKNIEENNANSKIQQEIKEIQKQNEVLSEQGYTVYTRDYTKDMYKVENINQYFLGKNNMLYIVFAYGNIDDTSEKDIVIFE